MSLFGGGLIAFGMAGAMFSAYHFGRARVLHEQARETQELTGRFLKIMGEEDPWLNLCPQEDRS